MSVISDTDCYTFADIVKRKNWNEGRVNKILGEPDRLIKLANGVVRRKLYLKDRVHSAESSSEFISKKDADSDRALRTKERANEIRESLISAIRIDLRSMDIPVDGTLGEVFRICRKQMASFDAAMRPLDMRAYEAAFSEGTTNGYICPSMAIYSAIARVRPDLAFEAGRGFERHTFGSLPAALYVDEL